mmetsp:Transcript_4972/g.8892  ORF Transcript_4972/g.8892 Transcript_4972/m.8892 type:complete len:223 (-) Transcript_4972:448-1116(-)
MPPFPRQASTSSTTTILTELTRTPPRVTILVSSVGVPTMTWGGSAHAQARWRVLEEPWRRGMIMIFWLLAFVMVSIVSLVSSVPSPSSLLAPPTLNCLATRTTCNPNSLVGTTTNAWTADRDTSIRLNNGSRKAKVLPDPVWECKITSGASSISISCISNGDDDCSGETIILLGNKMSKARCCKRVGLVYPNVAARSISHLGRYGCGSCDCCDDDVSSLLLF